jgi:hypothetical protein
LITRRRRWESAGRLRGRDTVIKRFNGTITINIGAFARD